MKWLSLLPLTACFPQTLQDRETDTGSTPVELEGVWQVEIEKVDDGCGIAADTEPFELRIENISEGKNSKKISVAVHDGTHICVTNTVFEYEIPFYCDPVDVVVDGKGKGALAYDGVFWPDGLDADRPELSFDTTVTIPGVCKTFARGRALR